MRWRSRFFGTLLRGRGLARFGDSAYAGVVGEQQVAGLEGFGFEVGAVAGKQGPVLDFAVEEFDAAQGGKFMAEGFWVVRCIEFIGED